MPADPRLIAWLQKTMASYEFDLVAVMKRNGASPRWPLTAKDPDDLVEQLAVRGHFVPLPREPAALANVMEVSLVDYIADLAAKARGVSVQRGTERGYPDLEFSGSKFGGGYHAVDIKMARRNKIGSATQNAITLYTGNTYFRHPTLQWPGTFRPFDHYDSHIDLIGIYTLDLDSPARIADLELLVVEPWRIASKRRSSSTREYIGAVTNLDRLRKGEGAFATEAEFHKYWRNYRFKIGPTVERQLRKLTGG